MFYLSYNHTWAAECFTDGMYMYKPFHGRMLPKRPLILSKFSVQSAQSSVCCSCLRYASTELSRFDGTQHSLSTYTEDLACCEHQQTSWTRLHVDCTSHPTMPLQVNTVLVCRNLKLAARLGRVSTDLGEHRLHLKYNIRTTTHKNYNSITDYYQYMNFICKLS